MTYQGIDMLELLSGAVNYNNALADLCLKNLLPDCNRIVDFGAGMGTLAEIFRQKNYETECIEKDGKLNNILKDKGFKTFSELNEYKKDEIRNLVSFNVFEHIEKDEDVFREVYVKLSKDGKFFLFLPAYKCLYSSFDKKLGHFRRYDRTELEDMLKNIGFKIEKSFYFDSIGFILAYIYKIINKNGTISEFNIKFYDRYLFKLSRLLDTIFCKIFGKNVVFVLSKK